MTIWMFILHVLGESPVGGHDGGAEFALDELGRLPDPSLDPFEVGISRVLVSQGRLLLQLVQISLPAISIRF